MRPYLSRMNLKTMFFRAYPTRIVVSVLALTLLTGCAARTSNVATSNPTKTAVAIPTYNSLSGRPGSDGPVLVVKVDDTTQAHPQIGLDSADVVYIEQVEGGLTRLAAVFSSSIPARIGPVRSARISDIDLISQYGHVAFAYSGAQTKMLPVIANANLENLGAQRESEKFYPRDLTRTAPVNLVLRADLLMARLANDNVAIATSKTLGWSFGSKPLGGKILTSVKLIWPSNSYSATWSTGEQRWLLFHAGSPDLADDGKQLGPTTLVIQTVSITNSIYHDKVGGITPFSATIGSGTGFILRDGESFPATWSRPSSTEGTTWTGLDGQPISFARGQVWVAMVATAPEFTYPAPPTPASPSATSTK